jgi:protein-S-isoprenylcysteine O-methyltransferase Ste14
MMHALLGTFLFRYRNVIGPVVFVFALLTTRPSYPLGRDSLNLVLDLFGIFIALLGEALRIVTIGYEYIERGGRDRQVYASRLVQGGVFAHCRNPLYVGNILLAFGLALIVHSTAVYLIVLPLVMYAYVAIVAAEELFLRTTFGTEFDAYCRRVNRWVPNWRGWHASIAGMRFSWRRVLVKEYNTVFVVLLALTAVKLWSDYQVRGQAVLPSAVTLTVGLCLWLAAYVLVRTMKKRGYVKG